MAERPRKPLALLFSELGELLWQSLPIIVTMGSHSVMQFVDTAMLARYGANELAAAPPAGLAFF